MFDLIEQAAPLRRNITQQDVAELATFLCTSAANNLTGNIVYQDAGFHIMGLAPCSARDINETMSNQTGERGARRIPWGIAISATLVVVTLALVLKALLTPDAATPADSQTPGQAAPLMGHYAPDVTLVTYPAIRSRCPAYMARWSS